MVYPLADSPAHTIRPFLGPADTVREMIKAAKGPRGEQSILVNSLRNTIVRDIWPKDYLGEMLAVRNFAIERIRYTNDALGVEQVQDPERITEQIVKYGRAAGDCDDLATWIAALCRQLGRDTQFVIVGFDKPGHFSHVFARAKEPKSGQWIVLDPVAGTNEGSMLRRVTTYQIHPLD